MFLHVMYRLVLTILITIQAQGVERQKLEFLTADYCPLTCKDTKNKGIMVDILHELFPANLYDVKVTFVPLKRAFQQIESSEYNGFVGGNKRQFPKNLFPKYVTTLNHVVFYKKINSKWSFKNLSSLNKEQVLAIKDFGYGDPKVNEYIQKNEFKNVHYLANPNHINSMVSLVSKQRYTTFIEGELGVEYFLKNHPSRKDIVADPSDVASFNNYISIYPNSKNSKQLVSRMNQEFKKLHKDGTLKEIYLRYGVNRNPKLIE